MAGLILSTGRRKILKHRIITTLLYDETGQVVKPVAFGRPYRRLGTLRQYVRVIENRNIDELILIDITATEQGREPNYATIRGVCDNLYCPVTVGGGVSSLAHIRELLKNGADKVAIKTSIGITEKAAKKFGSQAIVGVIDFIDSYDDYYYPWSYTRALKDLGVGEILLIDDTLDGTMEGYNLELIKHVSSVSIPIIACGGCGSPEHMAQALDMGASSVAAGSMFLYTDETPRVCAEYLDRKGYAVRT